jgi:hypothetical protein
MEARAATRVQAMARGQQARAAQREIESRAAAEAEHASRSAAAPGQEIPSVGEPRATATGLEPHRASEPDGHAFSHLGEGRAAPKVRERSYMEGDAPAASVGHRADVGVSTRAEAKADQGGSVPLAAGRWNPSALASAAAAAAAEAERAAAAKVFPKRARTPAQTSSETGGDTSDPQWMPRPPPAPPPPAPPLGRRSPRPPHAEEPPASTPRAEAQTTPAAWGTPEAGVVPPKKTGPSTRSRASLVLFNQPGGAESIYLPEKNASVGWTLYATNRVRSRSERETPPVNGPYALPPVILPRILEALALSPRYLPMQRSVEVKVERWRGGAHLEHRYAAVDVERALQEQEAQVVERARKLLQGNESAASIGLSHLLRSDASLERIAGRAPATDRTKIKHLSIRERYGIAGLNYSGERKLRSQDLDRLALPKGLGIGSFLPPVRSAAAADTGANLMKERAAELSS